MESPSEFCKPLVHLGSGRLPKWHEQFTRCKKFACYRIAERLLSTRVAGGKVRDAAASEPDVRQFVQQSKKTSRWRVCRVDEHDGRQWVTYSETTELTDVQFASSVVADDTAAHYEYTHTFGCVDDVAEIRFPGALSLFCFEVQHLAHIRRHVDDVRTNAKATHKRQGLEPMVSLVLDVPLLTSQGDADSFEEVNARPRDCCATDSSQVW